jgi:hypothetical protein
MSYTTANLSLISQQIDNTIVPKLWAYSGTDSNGTVEGSGYFSDGGTKGMAKGDIVFYVNTSTPALAIFMVTVVNATTGAVTVGSSPATAS